MAVRWGILSSARINRLFLGGARQAANVEVIAVASREQSRADEFARATGIERAHGSYEALLADPQVDALYIPLPNSLHIEWTVRALQAGKHVLCEKPLSRRASDVERAYEIADRHERLLMEAFMYRHHPQTSRLVALVKEGAVGRLRLVRGARLLAGEPLRVAAEQTLGGDGVDVVFTGLMQFQDDVVAHFDAGLALAMRDELEVVGEDGSLFLDDPWHCRDPVIELHGRDGVQRIEVERANSYALEAENFSDAIAGVQAPLLGREDAVGQARAIEALYEAAGSATTVTL